MTLSETLGFVTNAVSALAAVVGIVISVFALNRSRKSRAETKEAKSETEAIRDILADTLRVLSQPRVISNERQTVSDHAEINDEVNVEVIKSNMDTVAPPVQVGVPVIEWEGTLTPAQPQEGTVSPVRSAPALISIPQDERFDVLRKRLSYLDGFDEEVERRRQMTNAKRRNTTNS